MRLRREGHPGQQEEGEREGGVLLSPARKSLNLHTFLDIFKVGGDLGISCFLFILFLSPKQCLRPFGYTATPHFNSTVNTSSLLIVWFRIVKCLRVLAA